MLDEDKRGATERQGKIEVKWKLFQVKILNFLLTKIQMPLLLHKLQFPKMKLRLNSISINHSFRIFRIPGNIQNILLPHEQKQIFEKKLSDFFTFYISKILLKCYFSFLAIRRTPITVFVIALQPLFSMEQRENGRKLQFF